MFSFFYILLISDVRKHDWFYPVCMIVKRYRNNVKKDHRCGDTVSVSWKEQ